MQRVHWDPEFARRSGNPTTFDYGRMRETWLIHLCTDWMGDDAWLWKLDCEFRRFNYVGDTQWLRGHGHPQVPGRRRPARGRPRPGGREPAGRGDHARATPRSCCRAASTAPVRLPDPPGGATDLQGALDAIAGGFADGDVTPLSRYRSPTACAVALDGGGAARSRSTGPSKRNAIDDAMIGGLIDALDAAGRDEARAGDRARRARATTSAPAPTSWPATRPGRRRAPGSGSIQRRLPPQAHRLIPLVLRDPDPDRVPGAGLGGRHRLPPRARRRLHASPPTTPGSGSRSPSGASPPTAARPGCCPGWSAMVRARELLLLGRELVGRRGRRVGPDPPRPSPAAELDAAVDELVAPARRRADGRARADQVAAAHAGQPSTLERPAPERGVRAGAVVAQRGLPGGHDRVRREAAPRVHGAMT